MTNQFPHDALTLRTIAMPADANPNGDIFGGWLLAQMDLASGVEAMKFIAPVLIGDEVSCYAEAIRVGNTSVGVKVTTFARRRDQRDIVQVTEGVFTYVAIDANRNKRPIPKS